MDKKVKCIICSCNNTNPHFEKMDFWKLVDNIRKMNVEYVVLHPRLCFDGIDDGKKFWKDLGRADNIYIIGGCDRERQRKWFREMLGGLGINFDSQVISVDLWEITTGEGIAKIKEAINDSNGPQLNVAL